MTPNARRSPFAPLLAAALASALTAACATTPAPAPVAAAPAPAPVQPRVATAPVVQPAPPPVALPARERIRRAVEMLGQGRRSEARAEVTALLVDQPTSRVGKLLLDQIDRDPRQMLGERNYAYKVQPGETLSQLADRFLGDPLLFYGLARYNGIDAPDTTEAGRTLLIPGVARRPAPTAPAAAQAAPATALKTAAVDPARANGLRRTALEAMNRGSIDHAVSLLRQAAPLDPANVLIRADLDRALRIQASVRNR